MTRAELVRSLSDECSQHVEGRHVLAVSDSSEINLQSHVGRLKPFGVGVGGNNIDVGFYIHPTLVLDGESGFPYWLSTVQLWSRTPEHADKHERGYQNLPIEQKESYKWLGSAERSERCLNVGGAKMVTHIGDSDCDCFEEERDCSQQQYTRLAKVLSRPSAVGTSITLYLLEPAASVRVLTQLTYMQTHALVG